MLFTSILALLISNAVSYRRDKSILYSRIAIIILICCILLSFSSFDFRLLDKGIGLFGGLYHATVITHIFHIFIFIITLLIIQLTGFYPRKVVDYSSKSLLPSEGKKPSEFAYKYVFGTIKPITHFILSKTSQQYKIIEYPLIILFALMGGAFLISSADLISIFLSIELQSYALYILCAVYRNSERATSGALTYFLLGGLSSCFILLASSLIYGNSGTTSFDGLYVINNISGVSNSLAISNLPGEEEMNSLISIYELNYFNFALTIMSIGFLFKISAAPFHFWSPDVYDAIPTIVTTFVAVFAKISILILLLELVHFTNNMFISDLEFGGTLYNSDSESSNISWTFTLLISSFLSLIIGSLLGLTQSRIKRLYAYSTISHIGFILLAITINTIESTQSFIFYLMQYSISNVNAFLLLIAIGYTLYLYREKKDNKLKEFNKNSNNKLTLSNDTFDRNNSPVQLITDIKGFFYINPLLSISLGITIFSFVGIPPLIGFFAKQMVLTSALDNGYVFMAIIAILTSVISAYYYLVIIKQIFFEKANNLYNRNLLNLRFSHKNTVTYTGWPDYLTNEELNKEPDFNEICLRTNLTNTISILTLIILLFILAPQEWLNITTILSLMIFNF